MTDQLSPAAQMVLDAFGKATGAYALVLPDEYRGIAAALRAAVDQVLPLNSPDRLPPAGNSEAGHYVHGWAHCQLNARTDLLAIATELENADD